MAAFLASVTITVSLIFLDCEIHRAVKLLFAMPRLRSHFQEKNPGSFALCLYSYVNFIYDHGYLLITFPL